MRTDKALTILKKAGVHSAYITSDFEWSLDRRTRRDLISSCAVSIESVTTHCIEMATSVFEQYVDYNHALGT